MTIGGAKTKKKAELEAPRFLMPKRSFQIIPEETTGQRKLSSSNPLEKQSDMTQMKIPEKNSRNIQLPSIKTQEDSSRKKKVKKTKFLPNFLMTPEYANSPLADVYVYIYIYIYDYYRFQRKIIRNKKPPMNKNHRTSLKIPERKIGFSEYAAIVEEKKEQNEDAKRIENLFPILKKPPQPLIRHSATIATTKKIEMTEHNVREHTKHHHHHDHNRVKIIGEEDLSEMTSIRSASSILNPHQDSFILEDKPKPKKPQTLIIKHKSLAQQLTSDYPTILSGRRKKEGKNYLGMSHHGEMSKTKDTWGGRNTNRTSIQEGENPSRVHTEVSEIPTQASAKKRIKSSKHKKKINKPHSPGIKSRNEKLGAAWNTTGGLDRIKSTKYLMPVNHQLKDVYYNSTGIRPLQPQKSSGLIVVISPKMHKLIADKKVRKMA